MTAEDLKKATEFVLSDARSRLFVWWVLERAGLYQTPFTGNSETYHRIGRQDMGREILRQIEAVDPVAYPNMMLEMHRRAQQAEEENTHVSQPADE